MENQEERNIVSDIISGVFLNKLRQRGAMLFLGYIVALVLLYISINFGVAQTQMKIVRNNTILKNLKSDYTSTNARLLFMSKQGEVEKRLSNSGSKVKKPVHPPKIVEIPEN